MKMHKTEYEELVKKMKYLKGERLPIVSTALKDAADLGDILENSEFDSAQEEYAKLEKTIRKLEKEIREAEVVDKDSFDRVEVGATVKLNFDGESETYIVKNSSTLGEDSLSANSPLGLAIMHHQKGDEVTVQTEANNYTVKIEDIY